MPTTSNFGWTTPADTDLVKDGAAAIRTLGNGVDSSFVDLKGGTTGQILSKNSGSDLDFVWIANDQGDITAVTAGTGISGGGTSGAVTITNSMATEITAKGDLIVGTGNAAFDNLPAGTNGHVLTADSTVSPTGLKWAAPAGGGALTLISTTSFSSVASQSINDVFSSTYTNYKIIINCDTSINTQMDWRFRVSGSDDSNANYNFNRIEANGASSLTATGSYSQTAGGIAYIATTQGAVLLEVFNPQASRPTFWHGLSAQFATSSYNRVNFAGAYNGNTSFTGFTLLPASGNITGEVSVYGYSK